MCFKKECSTANDFTQDLADCRNFYRCVNGQLISLQCPMNTIFDSLLKICVCADSEYGCILPSTVKPPSTVSFKSE